MAAVSQGAERLDPDLTPLLDVVMQLIMFFMMCINFVNEQVNANVLLPTSTSAQELPPKTEADILVINIEVERQEKKDAAGKVMLDSRGMAMRELKLYPKRDNPDSLQRKTKILFAGQNPIEFLEEQEGSGLSKAQLALVRVARDRRAAIKRANPKLASTPVDKIPLSESVIIRADQDTRYGLVIRLMGQCAKEGFPKTNLRVNRAAQQ
jgi:biopolymer transport protein ExbD